MKKVLIFVDRDGTIIYDNKYYLGMSNNWRSMIKFLPKVIKGLKLLNKIHNSSVYIITHQPGIAIKDFPLLTLGRAKQVFQEVIDRIRKEGIAIKDGIMCPYASPAYAKAKKDKSFDKKFVSNCNCIKPKPGMIFKGLKMEGLKRKGAKIYVIGDRFSDVKMGLNANGIGILVPFVNEPGQRERVRGLKDKKKVYIAKDFLDAVRFIMKIESKYLNIYARNKIVQK